MSKYIEDSTKGKSLMLPKSYKGDVVVQMWIDSRILATLSNWLDKQGNYTRFMSEVVKDSLEILVNHLVEDGIELVDDTIYARQLLEMKYRINLNKGDRGSRNVQHNVALSNSRKALAGQVQNRKIFVETQPMVNSPSLDPRVQEAVRVFNSLEANTCALSDDEWREIQSGIEKEKKCEIERQKELFRDSGKVVADDLKTKVVKGGEE